MTDNFLILLERYRCYCNCVGVFDALDIQHATRLFNTHYYHCIKQSIA